MGLLHLILAVIKTEPTKAQTIPLPKPELISARQGLPQAFVPAIVQDKRGFIWMATRDGLARYDGYSFRVFQPTADGRPALSSPGLTNLTMAPDGYIWIQNDQFGLDGFDPVHETFLNLSRQPAYRQTFGRDTLLSIYPDSHRRLWLTFRRGGLAHYEMDSRRFVRHPHQIDQPASPGSNVITAIQEDGRGQLWIATAHGLDLFDPVKNGFSHVGYPAQFRTLLADNETITDPIRRLYRRPNGELWLCTDWRLIRWNPQTGQTRTYPLTQLNKQASWPNQIAADHQGVEYLNLGQQLFRYTDAQGLQAITIPNRATKYVSLFVDQSDVLWMGTDLAGVHKINLRAASFRNDPYQHSFIHDWLTDYAGVPAAQVAALPTNVSAYNFRSTIDASGQLWFAVGGTPLYRLDPVARKITSVAGPVLLRDYQLERPTLLSTDPDGKVWLVHPDWTGYYDTGLKRWVRFAHAFSSSIHSAMLQAVVDRQALWIATASTGLYRIDRRNGQIRHYQRQPLDSTSLSSDNLYWLNADPLDANQLWIGTFGSGLCQFDKRNGRSRRITTHQGLPNNVVYAAIPDRWGSVWIATNQGLGQLDQRTGQIRIYRQEDGLGADEFNRFHAVSMPDGRIILGSITGPVGFNPRTIRPDTFQPVVQLSDILVNNRSLLDSLLIVNPPDSLRSLTLPYNQNFITVRFAAMQYNRLGQALYRYQLSGLSPGWVVTQRPEAIFTALPPGTYRLQIQAANTTGRWSRYVRELTFTIQTPWWRSAWAYLAYGLVALGLVGAYIRFRYRQFRLQQERIVQQQERMAQQREADQLRRLDELKTRFFTNVTHELRTPLTLILGPTQQLKKAIHQPEEQNWLATIDRNAHQLLNLTNQLLDLSRLEAGVVRIDERPGDLSTFVAQVIESVRFEADKKGLKLTFSNELPAATYRFDAEKLERITLNLLTNAIKFTQQGSIHVTLRAGVTLLIDDTGPGLTTAEQERIFDRFYQAAPTSASSPGSGIGLALVSELVTLQGGTVRVESPWTTAHSGTRFIVKLPYQLVSADDLTPGNTFIPTSETTLSGPETDVSPDGRPLVLVVEDNDELREFIAQTITPLYRVQQAIDGQAGWEQALENGPDIIISDVLMPRMDGYTLCRRLKADLRTSHIPVLLLTAKVTHEDRLIGLTEGADAYLAKPFHVGELQLQLKNLLAQQQRQRSWLQQQLLRPEELLLESSESVNERTESVVLNAEVPFIDQVQAVLQQHLNDSTFGVEELARTMELSRVHLYRKVKALSGLTAVELLRNYRLGQARHLLRENHSVADVAQAVGFDDAGYFTRCFREQYGLTPTAYQQADHTPQS
ncbi:hybrid sensor histidine kinase/response regulator transcription factor [Spirosoma flavus]